jgi:NAD+ kinase
MKHIGIIAKHLSDPNILKDLNSWLTSQGIETVYDEATASQAGFSHVPRSEVSDRCEMIIVLGGDGTFLSVARLSGCYKTPILGINLGGLGFLTETNLADLYRDLEEVLAGRFRVERRMVLTAKLLRKDKVVDTYSVLNDVVIHMGNLVICSPTGSTAYSLSAGGPILYPTLDALLLNPICPHTLSNRPIVLPGENIVEILPESEDVTLTLDGQTGLSLKKQDSVRVERSDCPIQLICLPNKSYFDLLRTKLNWGRR